MARPSTAAGFPARWCWWDRAAASSLKRPLAIAAWSPVTYIIEGLRTLVIGWDGVALGKTLAAVGGIGAVSQYLAFSALKRRTSP